MGSPASAAAFRLRRLIAMYAFRLLSFARAKVALFSPLTDRLCVDGLTGLRRQGRIHGYEAAKPKFWTELAIRSETHIFATADFIPWSSVKHFQKRVTANTANDFDYRFVSF